MQKRKAWFFVLVALAVAAMFVLPGLATGDPGGGKGGGAQPKPCPTNKPRPNEPPPNCKPGDTDGSTTDGSTTDGSTTDGSTTDGSTTDGSTTDGATTGETNSCSPDTIALVDEGGPVKIHLEESDDTHSTGLVGLAHACVTLGQPPAPTPEAPCPAEEGDGVVIPGVAEVRSDMASYVSVCAHV
jgi:hypothetical protein